MYFYGSTAVLAGAFPAALLALFVTIFVILPVISAASKSGNPVQEDKSRRGGLFFAYVQKRFDSKFVAGFCKLLALIPWVLVMVRGQMHNIQGCQ